VRLLNLLFGPFVAGRGAVGLLALRVLVGAGLMIHGSTKIQSPFNWMGAQAPVPGFFQFLAAVSEFLGGLALIVGLLTPVAAFGVVCTMLVAAFMAHGADPFVASGGGRSKEPALLYLAPAFALMLAGPGTLSLDNLLFGRRRGHQAGASTDTAHAPGTGAPERRAA